ncbi:hypothetical protein [Chryseolinea soli]|uniref:Exo-alpha-sialidase n=1 Tax=Chryseolinea soli TaxID=2321403 RepID=A0A385SPI7_9BACT|nr:hypothetical protein [Chryseolinea soli]AYB31865.1 hypothetical protein D4L85_15415 [Chryseolinea soli]
MRNTSLKLSLLPFLIFLASVQQHAVAQTSLAPGEQPQMTVDSKGTVRLVFGEKDKIFYSVSNDKGSTFSKPVFVGEVKEMHLGMTRGPQLATSKDYSVVTAIDKKGTIHSFRLTHKTGAWEKIKNANDVEASAPEGLMSIAADAKNNFYAVWLDLRDNNNNNICFATLKENSTWSKNKLVYRSPEGHVCECCKPSIAVKDNGVSIMFRNWLKGSRDLYLITSSNGGETFSEGQKLGNGTWPLKGCPMDGGGLTVDLKNNIHTAWQRDGQIYYAQPGQPERIIGEGRSVGMSGNLLTWEKGSDLFVKPLNGTPQKIGEGTALKVYEFTDRSILAVWEKDDQVVFKRI